ncbi:hypothetical protein ACIQMP_27890 [Streptomyces sp. NPDC091385]|uniref:hypothetical protein n=1 Tax=Streptomyces sp. NPDC091385 TaxID=3365997 RepID=UPI00381AE1CA
MQRKADAVRNDQNSEWGWFLGWLAVGGCLALGLAALLSVGVALIAVGALGAVLLLRKGHRNALMGAIAGLGLPLFYLAYLNWDGPGDVCHSAAGSSTCTQEYAPQPFLIVGALLIVAGVLAFLVLDRRRRGVR